MDYGIKEKVALVGGASRGLGRSCAEALSREGARVAVCSRNAEAVAMTAKEIIGQSGGEVVAIAGDLAKREDAERVLAETRDRLGEIDILVTNTGGPPPGKFNDLKEEDWDAGYDLLLKSAIRLISGVLPGMRKRGWGRVIGITSVSVREPIGTLLLSNVFRAGVTAIFKSLATDMAAEGVTFNTVLPGLTDTQRVRDLYSAQAERAGVSLEAFTAKMTKSLPLKRLTHPDELGEMVAFLASKQASGITGSAIPADGGQLKGLM